MVMKMIWKSTFREIMQSLGRYLAIFAIVALGVGFFVGLKLAKPAMVETTNNYLDRLNFYDYRLLSTMGFQQEDVDFLAGQDGVEAVEGALEFDIIFSVGGENESVLKVHSITANVNQLELMAGRLPENTDECVVDSGLFGETAIGETIVFSDNNGEEDLEHFAHKEYKVVGIVQSPLYIQFERGNSSLGSGRVSGFAYILPEGFVEDFFTEIYVKFKEDFPLYSDRYDAFLDEKEATWEALGEEAAHMRYERIVEEAEEELADARETFEAEKVDAEEELADAKATLDDAGVQLEDGKKALADAEEELADAEKTLEEKAAELEDGKVELQDAEEELRSGEKTISDNRGKWEAENRKLADARVQLQAGEAELAAKEAELATQEQQLLAGEAELQAQISAMQEQLIPLQESKVALDAREAALQEQYGENIPEDILTELLASKTQLEQGIAEIEGGLALADGKMAEITAAKTAMAEGKAALEDASVQMDASKAQLDSGQAALNDAKSKLDAGQKEIDEGKAELEKAKAEIADGEAAIADAGKELEDAKKTLQGKEAGISRCPSGI